MSIGDDELQGGQNCVLTAPVPVMEEKEMYQFRISADVEGRIIEAVNDYFAKNHKMPSVAVVRSVARVDGNAACEVMRVLRESLKEQSPLLTSAVTEKKDTLVETNISNSYEAECEIEHLRSELAMAIKEANQFRTYSARLLGRLEIITQEKADLLALVEARVNHRTFFGLLKFWGSK
ncbi:hypothetical protein MMIC_P1576 [Mariprofundus micogutta]|uniref:Uncharacterized protein n=1 Tax=Mariprofundus micogutta TaxID=1921010 RepID=A0A1L8CNY2_9PROT|nr:hypothetical protein [Mariprofundus micogutta]GAV20604.1 hypothetical protein MMIC_P1576 [Mariprofundus micogutta]